MMLRLKLWITALVVALAACAPSAPALPTPPDAFSVLASIVSNLRQVNTFRMLIEQTGAEYPFYVSLDQGASFVDAVMRRGDAQFVSPNVLFAEITLRVGGLPATGVEIFARGAEQYFRIAKTLWIQYPVAEGFDPGELVAEQGGFAQALQKLREVAYVGIESLPDGNQAWHLRGVAGGDIVRDLLFKLLVVEGDVIVDVFQQPGALLPSLLTVTLPNTGEATPDDDTVWRIEIYDIDAEADFVLPDGVEL